MNRGAIFQYLEQNFDQTLDEVRAFLRHPSISYTGEGIRETAADLVRRIEALGGTAELVETPGHPVVYGEINSGAPQTLLIYGMYDVMPADEPGWIVGPWDAEIRDFGGLGPCILNRGAVNTKGPLAAFLCTLEAIKQVDGKLPVNLIFAIEGEEEFGSRNFPGFADQYYEKLKRADAMFFPFFYCDQEGTPAVTLGTKGMCYFELVARGNAEQGGPTTRGIHGSYAAWVNNPAWRLVHALAVLKDADEKILVEGLFDQVTPPNDEDMEIMSALEQFRDDELFLKLQEVKRFKYNKKGIELYRHLYFDPTLNINGLVAGFTEEGTKTLLPHEARAKVDIRMVPAMDPQETVRKVRAHLDKHGFQDVQMEMHNLYPWAKVSAKEPVVQALLKAYEDLGRKPQVVPLNPGSAPYYVFQRKLEMPYIAGGLGHGSRQHSSNEYCTVQGVMDFQKSIVAFFDHFVTGA